MRFPWSKKQEPEYYPIEKPPKKPESLHTLSEKIILREMKKNPEYGLMIAERVKSVAQRPEPPEQKTLQEQLRELTELKQLLGDAFGTDQKTSGLAGVIKDLLGREGVTAILQMMAQNMKPQEPAQGSPTVQIQAPVTHQSLPPVQPVQRPVQPAQNEIVPSTKGVKLESLIYLTTLVPEEVVDELGSLSPRWVAWLASKSYDQLVNMVKHYNLPEELRPALTELTSPARKAWVDDVLRLCREWTEEHKQNA